MFLYFTKYNKHFLIDNKSVIFVIYKRFSLLILLIACNIDNRVLYLNILNLI